MPAESVQAAARSDQVPHLAGAEAKALGSALRLEVLPGALEVLA